MSMPGDNHDHGHDHLEPGSVNEEVGTVQTELVVRVSAFGADAMEVPFVEPHKSVQYYLDQANVTVGRKQSVTLNGRTVWKLMRGRAKVTTPGSTIVVANKVVNG